MNSKYNTYDHLDKMKCIENEEIINIEKKFENFSVDNNYNYAKNIIENKPLMPNINIDLSKLIGYHKSMKISVEVLANEITLFNNYYESLTKWLNMSKCESIKEKSIIHYLFYFMCRCLFYIKHSHFCKIFHKFCPTY